MENIKFDGYSISNLILSRNEKKLKNNKLNLNSNSYRNNSNENSYKVILEIKLEVSSMTINMSMEGYFTFENITDKSVINQFLKVNAPTILYPYCRSLISSLTSFDSNNSVVLPIINFAELN